LSNLCAIAHKMIMTQSPNLGAMKSPPMNMDANKFAYTFLYIPIKIPDLWGLRFSGAEALSPGLRLQRSTHVLSFIKRLQSKA